MTNGHGFLDDCYEVIEQSIEICTKKVSSSITKRLSEGLISRGAPESCV